MAKTAGAKVVFGELPPPRLCRLVANLDEIVPMNLGGMGAAGMNNDTANQIAASIQHENAEAGPGPASNAGLISQMANI
jgi:hypothetical protein